MNKLGINIGKNYEQNKQEFKNENEAEKDNQSGNGVNKIDDYTELKSGANYTYSLSNDQFDAELKSISIDNVTLVMEINLKAKNNFEFENPDFKIKDIEIEAYNSDFKRNEELIITEKSSSQKMEDGNYKLFKYIAIKDPALPNNNFWSDVFTGDEVLRCKIIFEKFMNNNQDLEVNEEMKFEFDINKPKFEVNVAKVNTSFSYKNVDINVKTIKKSAFGNVITLDVMQKNMDLDKVNDIQKLKFKIQDASGNEIKIVSETKNIVLTDYQKGKYTGILLEDFQLIVDDIEENAEYFIKLEDDTKINIPSSELKKMNDEAMELKKSGKFVLTTDGVEYPMEILPENSDYYIDEYGVYRIDKTADELSNQ